MELKDKLSLEDAFEKKLGKVTEAVPLMADSDAKTEALEALTALGYSASDASKAVRRGYGRYGYRDDPEALLKRFRFIVASTAR